MVLYLKQRPFSWRHRYTAKNKDGKALYIVERVPFSMGKQRLIYNAKGTLVARIKQKVQLSWMPGFIIEVNGKDICEITQEKFGSGWNRVVKLDISGIPYSWEGVAGDIGYEFKYGESVIMSFWDITCWSWFGDHYELNITNSRHRILCLCIALVYDAAKFRANFS